MVRSFTRKQNSDILYAEDINELQIASETDDVRLDGKSDLGHTHIHTEVSDFDAGVQKHLFHIPNGNGELGSNEHFPNTTYVPTTLGLGDLGHFELGPSATSTTPWIPVGLLKGFVLYFYSSGSAGSVQVQYRRLDGPSFSLGTHTFSATGGQRVRLFSTSGAYLNEVRMVWTNTGTTTLKFGAMVGIPSASPAEIGAYTTAEVQDVVSKNRTKHTYTKHILGQTLSSSGSIGLLPSEHVVSGLEPSAQYSVQVLVHLKAFRNTNSSSVGFVQCYVNGASDSSFDIEFSDLQATYTIPLNVKRTSTSSGTLSIMPVIYWKSGVVTVISSSMMGSIVRE